MSASLITRPRVGGPLPRPGRGSRSMEAGAVQGGLGRSAGDFHVAGPSPPGSVGQPPALRQPTTARPPARGLRQPGG